MGQSRQCGHIWWTGPKQSAWLQMVKWAKTVSMATDGGLGLCCQCLQMVDWAHAADMDTDGGLGLCCQHGYRWLTEPAQLAYLQIVDRDHTEWLHIKWDHTAWLQMVD